MNERGIVLDPSSLPRGTESRSGSTAEPRVAVLGGELDAELAGVLQDDGWILIRCADGAALLEAIVERRPAAVLIVMGASEHDLRLLQLVRRVAPEVPLILLAREGDLGLRRTLQAMRPYYYDVGSFDPAELREAVRSAIRPARDPRPRR